MSQNRNMSMPIVVLERLRENVVCVQCHRRFYLQEQLTRHEAEHSTEAALKRTSSEKEEAGASRPAKKSLKVDSNCNYSSDFKQGNSHPSFGFGSTPMVSQVFSCGKCRRQFATHQSLKKHENKEHQRVPHLYRCLHCGMAFALQDTRNMHVMSVHEGLPRSDIDDVTNEPPSFSDKESCSTPDEPQLISAKHEWSVDESSCAQEEDQINRIESWRENSSSPGVVQLSFSLPPPASEGTSTTSPIPIEAEVTCEPSILYDCRINDDECEEDDDIGVVLDNDDPAHPFKCQKCCLSFIRESSLTKHKCGFNGSKTFECSLCESVFPDRSSLIKHVRKHFPSSSKEASETNCGGDLHQSASQEDITATGKDLLLQNHSILNSTIVSTSDARLECRNVVLSHTGHQEVNSFISRPEGCRESSLGLCEDVIPSNPLISTNENASNMSTNSSNLSTATSNMVLCKQECDIDAEKGAPSESGVPKRRRKISSLSKRLRDRGLEHVNSRGVLVRARRMGEGCTDECRFKCHSKISTADREVIFSNYWGLGNNVLQWAYIARHTTVCVPKRITAGRRSASLRYWFDLNGMLIKVCKSMFVNTLDISDSLIKTATLKQRLASDEKGFTDLRGKTSNRQISTIPRPKKKKKRKKSSSTRDVLIVFQPPSLKNKGITDTSFSNVPRSYNILGVKEGEIKNVDYVTKNKEGTCNAMVKKEVQEERHCHDNCATVVASSFKDSLNHSPDTSLSLIGTVAQSNFISQVISDDAEQRSAMNDPESNSFTAQNVEDMVVNNQNHENMHNSLIPFGSVCHDTPAYQVENSNDCEVSSISNNVQWSTDVNNECESGTEAKRLPKSVITKLQRDHGYEHINTRGSVVRARQMGSGCSINACRFKCHLKVTDEERHSIFNEYWGLGNNALQWAYIAKCTTLYAPKRVTGGRRSASRRYWFEVRNKMVNVCKSMFLTTLDISDSTVKTAIVKQNFGPDGAAFSDLRGKHIKRSESTPGEKKRKRKKIDYGGLPPITMNIAQVSTDPEVMPDLHDSIFCHQLVSVSSDDVQVSVSHVLKDAECDKHLESSFVDRSDFADFCGSSKSCDSTLDESERYVTCSPAVKAIKTEPLEESASQDVPDPGQETLGAEHLEYDDISCNASPCEESSLCMSDVAREEVANDDFEQEDSVMAEVNNMSKSSVKNLRDHGKEHVNSRGQTVRARRMGPGCGDSCRSKCQRKISDREREIIFSEYWALGNNSLQWAYIAKSTTLHVPKKITAGRRSASRRYWFEVGGRIINVCKSMFVNTLDISDSIIRTAIVKQWTDVEVPFTDNRGKHSKRYRAVNCSMEQTIIDHVNSFSRVNWRCCDNDRSKDYLEERAGSIANMYRLYRTWLIENLPDTPSKVVTERQYRDTFLKKFTGLLVISSKRKCEHCLGKRSNEIIVGNVSIE